MSNILLEKSEENFEAAHLLHNETLFCSSVHCSYYSSYQMMIYVFYEFFGNTEEVYNRSEEVNNAGSHNHLINLIRKGIRDNNNRSMRDFDENIRRLKELRKDADYKLVKIIQRDSSNAILNTEKVRGIIKTTFSI
jgi:uncharacterized protein (UPF0332 family)